MDDIFMLTSSSEEATAMDEKFQNSNRHIQFKVEHPGDSRSLALLEYSKMFKI